MIEASQRRRRAGKRCGNRLSFGAKSMLVRTGWAGKGEKPMRRKKSLIAGLVCGLLCIAAILLYAQELNDQVEAERAEALARFGGEQVEAYVATKDIAAGEAVTAANSEKRLWVGELLPQDAVLDLATVEGKALSSPVYAGEVVSMRRFEGRGAATLQVPEGLCAVSVPSKSVSAVGGSVTAGSTVDVYATSGTATERLAASVLVLSTSATSAEGDDAETDISWVTLAVAPDLVQELIEAAQKTELYFTLPSEGASLDAEDAADSGEGSEGETSWNPGGDATGEAAEGAVEAADADGAEGGNDSDDAVDSDVESEPPTDEGRSDGVAGSSSDEAKKASA